MLDTLASDVMVLSFAVIIRKDGSEVDCKMLFLLPQFTYPVGSACTSLQ